jgi:hypothetical protein
MASSGLGYLVERNRKMEKSAYTLIVPTMDAVHRIRVFSPASIRRYAQISELEPSGG